jgi:hypothetical protein
MLREVAQMIQLGYQPAYDPYHAAFRLMRLLNVFGVEAVSFHTVRIADFYLCFPHLLNEVRLPNNLRVYKKLSQDISANVPYGNMPDKTIIFGLMRPFQEAAAQTLAYNGYIDGELIKISIVKRTDISLPKKLQDAVDARNEEEHSIVSIVSLFPSIKLEGKNGLKDRTGLMEHRYDAA